MGKHQYIAFLRGINLGGNHKLPMADLKDEVLKLGFEKPETLLNSGNLVFEGDFVPLDVLEKELSDHLRRVFGFPVPVLLRSPDVVMDLIHKNPFSDVKVTKDIRLYVSFLASEPQVQLDLPWASGDSSYRILECRGRTVCSVLDLSNSQTTKGMDALEQLYGKNITTRNFNTIKRIAEKWLKQDS
jgi:uncharacterized protein (DUF1697 family)